MLVTGGGEQSRKRRHPEKGEEGEVTSAKRPAQMFVFVYHFHLKHNQLERMPAM